MAAESLLLSRKSSDHCAERFPVIHLGAMVVERPSRKVVPERRKELPTVQKTRWRSKQTPAGSRDECSRNFQISCNISSNVEHHQDVRRQPPSLGSSRSSASRVVEPRRESKSRCFSATTKCDKEGKTCDKTSFLTTPAQSDVSNITKSSHQSPPSYHSTQQPDSLRTSRFTQGSGKETESMKPVNTMASQLRRSISPPHQLNIAPMSNPLSLSLMVMRSKTESALNRQDPGCGLKLNRTKSCLLDRKKPEQLKSPSHPEDKFRNLVEIYLDTDWLRARKLRLKRFAEKIQVLKKVEAENERLRKAAGAKNSIKRQQEQLQYVRGKYIAAKVKRVATQHVKWRFVRSSMDHREEYGLPSS